MGNRGSSGVPSSGVTEAQHDQAASAASAADAALVENKRREAAARLVDGAGSLPDEVRRSHDADHVVPLFEAKTSPLGGDVDASGDRLLVWPDRVEHYDSKGRLLAGFELSGIEEVLVRKRLTSSTLTVRSTSGEEMKVKGVKSSNAARFRDAVATVKLVGASNGAGRVSTATALKQLEQLASMGLLTEREVADKRAMLVKGTGA